MHRTTLVFPDTIWKKIRKGAAETGLSISEFVTIALQKNLKEDIPDKKTKVAFEWKSGKMGDLKIDVTTREGMYELVSRRL